MPTGPPVFNYVWRTVSPIASWPRIVQEVFLPISWRSPPGFGTSARSFDLALPGGEERHSGRRPRAGQPPSDHESVPRRNGGDRGRLLRGAPRPFASSGARWSDWTLTCGSCCCSADVAWGSYNEIAGTLMLSLVTVKLADLQGRRAGPARRRASAPSSTLSLPAEPEGPERLSLGSPATKRQPRERGPNPCSQVDPRSAGDVYRGPCGWSPPCTPRVPSPDSSSGSSAFASF